MNSELTAARLSFSSLWPSQSQCAAALLCSAMALVSLSLQSRRLTAVPPATGTCRVHDGFCLAVEWLVACLEHVGARVVEALMLWRPRMR